MPGLLSYPEVVSDPWLTRRLGRPVFSLDVDALDAMTPTEVGPAARAVVSELPSPAMVQARVALRHLAPLTEAGFHLVDMAVVLERDRLPAEARETAWPTRLAGPDDEADVAALARASFRFTRFHLDPQIEDDAADAIKAAWAANGVCGRRGDAVVVAVSPDGIVGFLIGLEAADHAMVIDLVAVDERQRGRGLAGDLTHAAQACFPDATRLRVGTQLANRPALRAYRTLGFEVTRAEYVVHLHRR